MAEAKVRPPLTENWAEAGVETKTLSASAIPDNVSLRMVGSSMNQGVLGSRLLDAATR